jgi:hypothetical protein
MADNLTKERQIDQKLSVVDTEIGVYQQLLGRLEDRAGRVLRSPAPRSSTQPEETADLVDLACYIDRQAVEIALHNRLLEDIIDRMEL